MKEVRKRGDIPDSGVQKILAIGPTGSGKTSLINTLPGRVFVYVFDPNVTASIRRPDIELCEFIPEVEDLDLSAKSLRKKDGKVVGDKPVRRTKAPEPLTYRDWETDFDERMDSGYFDQYDWVAFDSLTTFQEIIMDRVLYINERPGKFPEQDDWTAQMNTIRNVFRVMTGQKHHFFCTGHTEVRQDEATKRMVAQLLVTGRLRIRLPQLFTNIWACESLCTEEKDEYIIQTRPDRMHPTVRNSVDGLSFEEEVTIKNWKKPLDFGVNELLNRSPSGKS